MPKVTGLLYPDLIPAVLAAQLNFSSDGHVRRERHVLPDPTPGVAISRLYIKTIDSIIKQLRPELQSQLIAATEPPLNWAAQITSQTIGHGRAHWSADEIAFNTLPLASRADWKFAAYATDLQDVTLIDTRQITHRVLARLAFFHVATGIFRLAIDDQPTQPAANNANAWAAFMFTTPVAYPNNVLTLNNGAISIGEEILTS
jgi:hypothetical protein